MEIELIRKNIIFGIIILFIGTCFTPSINGYFNEEILDRDNEIIVLSSNNLQETFNPTDDAYISMPIPNTNTGDLIYLSIRNRYGSTPNWGAEVLIRFDISSIPSGSNIDSAYLYLYYFAWADRNPVGRELTCYRITSNWDENTVTWNTRPGISAGATSTEIVPSSFRGLEWDVTYDVQNFVDENMDNYGWQIIDEEYWGGYDIPLTYCHSKEYGSLIPYLEITYEDFDNSPPYIPSNPIPLNHAEDIDVNAVLSWTGGDPDPGNTVTYDVYFGITNPPPNILNDISPTSFIPGTMNEGTTYYWQIVSEDNHGAITSGYIWDFTTSGTANNPPMKPILTGDISGKVGRSYMYSAITTDPDDDKLYYKFDWGDGTDTDWTGTFDSNKFCNESHIWNDEGTFVIKVKAKDVKGAESDWETLEISMPKNKNLMNLMLERFPIFRYLFSRF